MVDDACWGVFKWGQLTSKGANAHLNLLPLNETLTIQTVEHVIMQHRTSNSHSLMSV